MPPVASEQSVARDTAHYCHMQLFFSKIFCPQTLYAKHYILRTRCNYTNTQKRNRLVKKLDLKAGIRGRLLQWIENYMSEREERTHFRVALSKRVRVTSGMP